MDRGRICGSWFVGDGIWKDAVRVMAGWGGWELWRLFAHGEARLAGA